MAVVRILLADDNIDFLANAGLLLRALGYEVTSTNSGADALCLLANKKLPPDVFVLDLKMPGMDGIQVLNQLGPSAPRVVVMSGDPDMLALAKLQHPWISRALPKPIYPEVLQEVIENILIADQKTPPQPIEIPRDALRPRPGGDRAS